MQRLRCLLVLLLFLIAGQSWASHIVGGEFELLHTKDYQFKLNLIQYFDEVHGHSEAEDGFADAYVFSKKGEVLIDIFRLPRISSEFVNYTNPACGEGELVTRRILYSADIILPPAKYNDPEGYFVVYERCCRNEIISNLVSPTTAGEAFYMEFPAVTADNKPFYNSSPALSPPVNDYACIGVPFRYDFRSTDPDGDSLVYSLAAPFNSSTSTTPLPRPFGSPKSTVTFTEGISAGNMVPGNPALQISKDGFISVVPDREGVFVFSVQVEEYRKGSKIGEIRRDFQLAVKNCNPGTAPVATARVAGAAANYQEGSVIRFEGTAPKCVTMKVTDADPGEIINIRLISVNFEHDLSSLLPTRIFVPQNPQDTISFDLCFPECPLAPEPMLIDVVALDDACSQPLTDTVRLTIDYEGPANEAPFIVNNPNVINALVDAGGVYELPLQGIDNDGDQLLLEVTGDGFDPAAYGMTLVEELLVPGEVKKTFRWNADCSLYDFSRQQTFLVTIRLSDNSDCSFGQPDSLQLRLTINTPANNRPKLTFDKLASTELTVGIDETVSFDVLAQDLDLDFIRLTAVGDGFDLADYNINFPGNTGVKEISSPFSWRLSCNTISLEERSTFDIYFIAADEGTCGKAMADTVRVSINVLPPTNDAPEAYIQGQQEDTIRTFAGYPVYFDVTGTDPNEDLLTLRLIRVVQNNIEVDQEATSINFFTARAYEEVTATFSWVPDCAVLTEANKPSFTEVYFAVEDDKCFNAKGDTIRQVIAVYDRPLRLNSYEPANAFTPNGDDIGDYFYLPTLPSGNCFNRFERIAIFNRWGRSVFTSDDINFRWYAKGMPAGVYYYIIYYTGQIYKNEVYVHLEDK